MKELIRKLGEQINNRPHTKLEEGLYYFLCNLTYNGGIEYGKCR